MGKQKGLTLIEVLIAVAFISILYAFVMQVFFHAYGNVNEGDIQNEATRLAKNEIIRLSSISNPLFIGLEYLPNGENLILQLKAGEITPFELVENGTIKLKEKETVYRETTGNSDELQRASNARAIYSRKIEWEVASVKPALVHIWVTVNWTDPEKKFKESNYLLESMFAE